MSIREERRAAALDKMADHVLREGLAAATLRPLAAAVGTSDRMLLYYFADKDELLAEVFDRIAGRLLRKLEEALPLDTLHPLPELIRQVWKVLGSEEIKPYMDVWLELASSATRSLEPHRGVAGRIADGYLSWVKARLRPERGEESQGSAAYFLSLLQGMYLLTAIGQAELANTVLVELDQLSGRYWVDIAETEG